MSNLTRRLFLLALTCLFCSRCEKTPASIAVDEVLQCADFSDFIASNIEPSLDSVFISGTLDGAQINMKEGFEDYQVRFVDEERFILNNPSGPNPESESNYQITFAIGQAAAAGSSFVGAPLFSASIQFPCSESLNDPIQYVNQFETGIDIPVLGRGMGCDEGVKIVLRAYCFEFNVNGTGYYTSTPLSSEGGQQGNNNMVLERISATSLPNGQIMVDIEGTFSSNLYFNTTEGSGHFFGTLSNARFRITRVLE
jgi:hypothetical protein